MKNALRNLLTDCTDYLKGNTGKAICVALAMLLGYGFYICSYTVNIDDIFTDFYNGGRLIAAGRFTGWLLQLFTGFLTYSPFFTMALGVMIYYVAGLVYAVVLNRASGHRLSAAVQFVFWLVFVTYPIIAEQMVYPIIHLLALGYLLVAVSLHLFMEFRSSRQWSLLCPAIIAMVLTIDFYEAFASVYLTLLMALCLVKFGYAEAPEEMTFKYYLKLVMQALALLVCAVVVRQIIAIGFMYGWYGTGKSGYSGNSSLYWFAIGPFDCAFWLVRTLFLKYCWAGIAYFPIFVFVLACLLGLLLSLGRCRKSHSSLPFLLFAALFLSAISLNIVLGLATNYTMAQALTPFVAFVIAWGYQRAESCPVCSWLAGLLIAVLVLNQVKSLNTWSVINYKRCQYEMGIVDRIGVELVARYPVKDKPVVFLGAPTAPHLPAVWQQENENNQVLARLFRKGCLRLSDALLPRKYLQNIGGFYNQNITNADELYDYVKTTRCCSSASVSYLSWTKGYPSWFGKYEKYEPYGHTYGLFQDKGYDFVHCPVETYEKYKDAYKSFPAYPLEGYIQEKDDAILVNFGQ